MMKVGTVRTRRFGIAAGLMAALAMGSAMAPLAAAQKPIAVTPPAGAPMSFADLIERVSPAVASVQVTTEVKVADRNSAFNPFRGLPGFDEYEDQFGEDKKEEGAPEKDQEGNALGSGFFISPQGYIVTNNHVVENAREVTVTLKNGDQIEVDIVGTDE
mgnify:FL=1